MTRFFRWLFRRPAKPKYPWSRQLEAALDLSERVARASRGAGNDDRLARGITIKVKA